MRMNKIRELIIYACDECGVPELARSIRVEFNRRFTRRLGDACYYRVSDSGLIRLSSKLWPTMDEIEQENTILHEVAHIITDKLHPEDRRFDRSGHGPYWKKIAAKVGAKAERFAKANVANFKAYSRKNTRYRVSCGCPNGIVITKARHTKMTRGYSYLCRKCDTILGIHVLEKV